MMRLIDLDQTILVPIVDESKGGVEYEMEMTIAEFFDKFLDGFQPEIVDAIPVEWMRTLQEKEGVGSAGWVAIEVIIQLWDREQKEQEGR